MLTLKKLNKTPMVNHLLMLVQVMMLKKHLLISAILSKFAGLNEKGKNELWYNYDKVVCRIY